MKNLIHTATTYRTWFLALAVILTIFFISGSMADWINLTEV